MQVTITCSESRIAECAVCNIIHVRQERVLTASLEGIFNSPVEQTSVFNSYSARHKQKAWETLQRQCRVSYNIISGRSQSIESRYSSYNEIDLPTCSPGTGTVMDRKQIIGEEATTHRGGKKNVRCENRTDAECYVHRR
jgi:hypothetical protein